MRDFLAFIRELECVDDIHIQQAVTVVVEQGDATPAGLHDVVLRATPAERLNRNTGHFLELYRRSDARSRAAGRRKIRRRTHRAAMAAIDRFGHLRLAVASLKGEIERSIEPRRDAAQQREKWLDR